MLGQLREHRANKIRLLEPDLLRRLLDEQATLTAEIKLLPGRIADTARRLDRLTHGVEQLQETATDHRDRIIRNQEQLDGHLERGVLHRARNAKTIQGLETAITNDRQRLATVEQNITAQQDPQRRQAAQLTELQRRQTEAPDRLQKISALIDTDRTARLENAIRTRTIPRAVAEAITPLGRRQDQPEHHRNTWDRRVGGALQREVAYGQVPRVEPILQPPAQRIERGPRMGW